MPNWLTKVMQGLTPTATNAPEQAAPTPEMVGAPLKHPLWAALVKA